MSDTVHSEYSEPKSCEKETQGHNWENKFQHRPLLIASTIRAIVGIRVLNKTSEEYWFLMKFNLSHVGGNMEIRDVTIMTRVGGGGGTPIYGLDRYVPPDRIWFLRSRSLNRVSFLPWFALRSWCEP